MDTTGSRNKDTPGGGLGSDLVREKDNSPVPTLRESAAVAVL